MKQRPLRQAPRQKRPRSPSFLHADSGDDTLSDNSSVSENSDSSFSHQSRLSSVNTSESQSKDIFRPSQIFSSSIPIFRMSDIHSYEPVEKCSDEQLSSYTFKQALELQRWQQRLLSFLVKWNVAEHLIYLTVSAANQHHSKVALLHPTLSALLRKVQQEKGTKSSGAIVLAKDSGS
jgi:hypothetical protein